MSDSAANSVPGNAPEPRSIVEAQTAVATVDVTTVAERADDQATVMKVAKISTDVFNRDLLLTRVDITNADTPFINLVGFFPCFEAYLNNTFVQNHVYGYKFYRGDLVLKFNLVTPGSCFGAYVIQALCDGYVNPVSSGIDDQGMDDIHTSCSDVFGILNCETGNSVELRLPFVNPYECAPTAGVLSTPLGNSVMWRILVWPLTPVTSTIATTALGQITCFAHMENPVFEVQKFQGKDAFKKSLEKGEKKQGTVGRIASTTAKVAAAVTNVAPFLAPFTGPLAIGMGAVATIADIFGFTRESSPLMPNPLVSRLTSSLAPIDGSDPSDPIALANGNAVSIDPRIGGGEGEDPMSFGSLFERWTLVRSFSISKATPVGGVYNIPVTPTLPGVTLGRAFHTVAGYVGLPFSYWSGDMEYLIYIPSSANVKGSLQVFWDPAVFPTIATTYVSDPTVYLSGTMIDLCGSSATYLKVDMAGQVTAKLNEPVYETGTTRSIDYCNGSLAFYLNAEVTTPRTDGVPVTVLIFARGGKNMKFHVPKALTTYGGSTSSVTTVNTTFRLQGLREFDPTVESTHVDLTDSTQLAPVVQINYGEDIASCRGLAQKFSYAGPLQLSNRTDGDVPRTYASLSFPRRSVTAGDGNGIGYFPGAAAYGYDTLGDGTVINYWSWAGHYLQMFCGFRGGHRIKVFQRDVGASEDVIYPLHATAMCINDLANLATLLPQGSSPSASGDLFTHEVIQPVTRGTGAEYSIPYYGAGRYTTGFGYVTKGQDYPHTDRMARGLFWLPAWAFKAADTTKIFDLYMAGGPDISVARYRRVPGLIIAP